MGGPKGRHGARGPRSRRTAERLAGAALLALGAALAPSAARAEPALRLYDGALVLRPYVMLHLDAGTTFGHDRSGGPGAGVQPRRMRLGGQAELQGNLEFVAVADFGGPPGDVRARPYQVSLAYSGLGPFTLTGGLFKQQFALEEMQSDATILFLERAAIVSVAIGVAAGSERLGLQLRTGGERWIAAAALTGGGVGPGTDSGQRGAAARVAGLPVQAGDLVLHLGLSGAVSWQPPRRDGQAEVALSARPELAIDEWNNPLGTGGLAARRARTGGVEAGLGWRRFWSQAEAYRIEVDRAGQRGGTLRFDGWYAQAAYTVLGVPRRWNEGAGAWGPPTPDGDGLDPSAGRWGAVELGARISELDLSDQDVRGGRQRVWTVGGSWWPAKPLRLTLQYQHATIRGTEEDRRFQAVALRAQVYY